MLESIDVSNDPTRRDGRPAMNAFELLKSPDKAENRPLVAIFGDEAYLRRECLEITIQRALGTGADDMAISRFAADASLAEVLDELRTLPFLSKKRVVVMESADTFVTAHRKELEAYAERPSSTGVLILLVKQWPSNTKLAKLFAKNGLDVDCKAPSEKELPGWLVQFAKTRCGSVLQAAAAGLLLELVGPEIGLLTSEVEKLTVYVGPNAPITRDDVAKMVGAGRVETIWRTIDAALSGRSGEALADLDGLMESGEHPVGLLAAMTSSLRKVHHAGQLRLARVELEEACRIAGIYSARAAGEQHQHLGPARIDQLPRWLLQADLDLKGSTSLPPEVVMERLIVRLARKRQDARTSGPRNGR